jgi:hypothetical protein
VPPNLVREAHRYAQHELILHSNFGGGCFRWLAMMRCRAKISATCTAQRASADTQVLVFCRLLPF